MRIFLFTLLFCTPMFADINSELNNFFDKFGSQSNTTSAEIYEGQKAGYLTGGGLTVRNRVMDVAPLTVNLPKFDAGCGGIDIYAGGFSFINNQQLIETLKGIGSSAVGYAFLLGLETVSPQVSNTIKQLQTWANNINSFNINSCEAAANLVGAVWPRDTQASQHVCRTLGGKTGLFNDYLSARHNCSQSSEHDNFSKKISANSEYKDLLIDEYNLVWKVLQKQPYLANDKELAELFMTLMGTVVVTKKNGQTSVDTIPSKIQDESFLKSMIEGGDIALTACGSLDDKQCLIPTVRNIKLSDENCWSGKIKTQLLHIQQKILKDQELSDTEQELLSKSRLPLYKIVNVLTAYKHGYCPLDVLQIANIVAMDLLAQFLKESLEIVREGCQQLRRIQLYDKDITDYLASLDRAEETVQQYEIRSSRLLQEEFQLMQKVQLIEGQIAAEIFIN